jgi:hypothetical protein
LRHGLSIPSRLDPAAADRVKELTHALDQVSTGYGEYDFAKLAAEAQVDVERVQQAKAAIIIKAAQPRVASTCHSRSRPHWDSLARRNTLRAEALRAQGALTPKSIWQNEAKKFSITSMNRKVSTPITMACQRQHIDGRHGEHLFAH